jgi:aldehyde:ferredoxin oxidoreductase
MNKNWKGYSGRILEIDLSKGKSNVKDLMEGFAKKYIGGRGFSSRILWENVNQRVGPYDKANRLIFAAGPLTGTMMPSASRLTIAAKSPISNAIGDSNSGGYWAPELKYAGYDAIVITGKAAKPVYLFINNDYVDIRNAEGIWGKNTHETESTLKAEIGNPELKIASIGPAGENLVRFASVVTDSFGSSSRCGLGAVMGSKNLKAVALKGSKGIDIAAPSALKNVIDKYLETILGDAWITSLTKMGTLGILYHREMLGIHQVKNSREGLIDNFENIKPEVFRNKYQGKATACMGCSIRCRRYSKIPNGLDGLKLTRGPEYVTINSLGMKPAVTDPEVIVKAHGLCDLLGLDAEATGSVIGLAMELYEKKIIDKKITTGMAMHFGDADILLTLIPMIANRTGIGDLLAEGAKRFAERCEASYYANVIKGMDIEAGDPRNHVTRALCYGVSTRGSCHLRSWPYIDEFITPEQAEKAFGTPKVADFYSLEGKGAMLCWSEDLNALADLMGVCKFAYYRSRDFPQLVKRGIEIITEAYNAATGFALSEDEVLRAGERVNVLERCYNYREGLRRIDDYPNERMFKEPIKKGPSEGKVLSYKDYGKVLDDYYDARGCDKKTGRMLDSKLKELDLEDVTKQI